MLTFRHEGKVRTADDIFLFAEKRIKSLMSSSNDNLQGDNLNEFFSIFFFFFFLREKMQENIVC